MRKVLHKKSFTGPIGALARDDPRRFEVDQEDYDAMSPVLSGATPIRTEHNNQTIGRVTASWMNPNRDWEIEYEIDDSKVSKPFVDLILSGCLGELSLKHNATTRKPIEVSLCWKGAREGSVMTSCKLEGNKQQEYKAIDNDPSIICASASRNIQSSEMSTTSPSSPPPSASTNGHSWQIQQQPNASSAPPSSYPGNYNQMPSFNPFGWNTQFYPPPQFGYNPWQYGQPPPPPPSINPNQQQQTSNSPSSSSSSAATASDQPSTSSSSTSPPSNPPNPGESIDPFEKMVSDIKRTNLPFDHKEALLKGLREVMEDAQSKEDKIKQLKAEKQRLESQTKEGDAATADALVALLKTSNLPSIKEKADRFQQLSAEQRNPGILGEFFGPTEIVAASHLLIAKGAGHNESKEEERIQQFIASRKRIRDGNDNNNNNSSVVSASASRGQMNTNTGGGGGSGQSWVNGMPPGAAAAFSQYEHYCHEAPQKYAREALTNSTWVPK